MSIASTMILSILLSGGFLLLLFAVIGFYVWRDASRRKMNPVLWTLVAVIAPAFVGFIIYLLVRSHFPDLACPSCGTAVEKTYVVCPGCGVRLKRACTKCGFPAEENWVVCPKCAEPLLDSENVPEITPPVRKKDQALWKVLLLIFLIPALLFTLLCILNLSVPSGGLQASSLRSYDEEKMEQYQEIPEIWDWLQSSREKDLEGVYVLGYQGRIENEESPGRKETVYLIYRPSTGYMKAVNEGARSSFWRGTDTVITFEDTFDPGWSHAYYPLTCYVYEGDEYRGLELVVDGRRVDYELQVIDFDPSLEAYYIRAGIFEER